MSSGISQTVADPKRRVLLVVHTRIFFPRMIEFGTILAQSGLYHPVFHFAYKSGWGNLDTDISLLKQRGFDVSAGTLRAGLLRHGVASLINSSPNRQRPSGRSHLKAWLNKILGSQCSAQIAAFANRLLNSNLVVSLAKGERRLLRIGKLLQEERPEIVVIAIDVPTWDTASYIRCCRKRGIPTVMAFSQTGPLDEAAYLCVQQWHLRTTLPLNFLMSKISPKWVYQLNGKRFLMMGFGETLAKELLGTTMPQPWIEGSSNADAVLVENQAYLQRGARAGLVASNLHVTGYPFHDALHCGLADRDACRARVRAAHGLRDNKPIILTSLLPNYAGRSHSDSDFATYEEMVRFWIETLVSYDEYHTIVSLHPTQVPAELAYIQDLGAVIACQPIPEIMPACHIYVASLSSTITMAAACGIPVLNYDYAHYGNTHYADARGVIHVTSRDQFSRRINKLLRNPSYHEEVSELQTADASRWGQLDGKAAERIIGLFRSLHP